MALSFDVNFRRNVAVRISINLTGNWQKTKEKNIWLHSLTTVADPVRIISQMNE